MRTFINFQTHIYHKPYTSNLLLLGQLKKLLISTFIKCFSFSLHVHVHFIFCLCNVFVMFYFYFTVINFRACYQIEQFQTLAQYFSWKTLETPANFKKSRETRGDFSNELEKVLENRGKEKNLTH